jgi:ribosomal-protein-alanine N-acetyltransferase
MTEALSIAINYVFEELNLHRIMANYMPHNRRSGNVLKRLGFVVEGYARDYLMINGKWEDHIFTSLINPHWRSHL